jgi:hypothetical protein
MADVGNPRKGMFESKAKFKARRAAELAQYATQANKPPSDKVDTKGRPIDPNRVLYAGWHGYDKTKEPQKTDVAVKHQFSISGGHPEAKAVRAAAESQMASRALGAADFKKEIAGLSKSSPKYEEQRKELFARRQLGKRAGK